MKTSKSKVAVLMLFVVTVVYAVALCVSIQNYEAWKNEKLNEYPPAVRPYVDFEPFLASSYGILYLPFSMLLILAWVGLLVSLNLKKRTKILIRMILPVCIGCTLIFPVAYATPETVHADVFCVADEEALGSFGFPGNYENVLNHIAGFYLDNFDIEFHYHWWYLWDSDDSKTDPVALLYEAISEMGWYWSKFVDEEPMELMIVISGQCPNFQGWSPPWERAFILGLGYGNFYYHEMGHQFSCDHCSEFPFPYWSACWMHYDPLIVGEFGCYYCSRHYSTIMANRDCLLKPVPTMKTKTDGWFYIPNFPVDIFVIELLFDDGNIVGDQIGPTYFPDGTVDMINDIRFISGKFGVNENQSGWDYMADVVPNRKIDIFDTRAAAKNFGKSGTYITSFAGVEVAFNVGGTRTPDSYGFVEIPSGATSFNVTRYGWPIGAMLRIGKWLS